LSHESQSAEPVSGERTTTSGGRPCAVMFMPPQRSRGGMHVYVFVCGYVSAVAESCVAVDRADGSRVSHMSPACVVRERDRAAQGEFECMRGCLYATGACRGGGSVCCLFVCGVFWPEKRPERINKAFDFAAWKGGVRCSDAALAMDACGVITRAFTDRQQNLMREQDSRLGRGLTDWSQPAPVPRCPQRRLQQSGFLEIGK
jgi:hypothetical protein